MRLLKLFFVAAVVLAILDSPSVLGSLRHTATGLVHRAAAAANIPTATATDSRTPYARICPLLAVWSEQDAAGRAATAHSIIALARRQHTGDDPAVRAFLYVLPDALHKQGSAAASAHAFVSRECHAHDE